MLLVFIYKFSAQTDIFCKLFMGVFVELCWAFRPKFRILAVEYAEKLNLTGPKYLLIVQVNLVFSWDYYKCVANNK